MHMHTSIMYVHLHMHMCIYVYVLCILCLHICVYKRSLQVSFVDSSGSASLGRLRRQCEEMTEVEELKLKLQRWKERLSARMASLSTEGCRTGCS